MKHHDILISSLAYNMNPEYVVYGKFELHAMQQAKFADMFRENFHGTYTDFAVSFCENSRHAHIPTHWRIRLRTAKCIRFVNMKTSFRGHTCTRQDWSLDVHVRRRIKRVSATYSKYIPGMFTRR